MSDASRAKEALKASKAANVALSPDALERARRAVARLTPSQLDALAKRGAVLVSELDKLADAAEEIAPLDPRVQAAGAAVEVLNDVLNPEPDPGA